MEAWSLFGEWEKFNPSRVINFGSPRLIFPWVSPMAIEKLDLFRVGNLLLFFRIQKNINGLSIMKTPWSLLSRKMID
jgi:hypothetical protein